VTTGGGIANRAMRSRIAANRSRVTATSASWNVTYFACRVTLAAIFAYQLLIRYNFRWEIKNGKIKIALDLP